MVARLVAVSMILGVTCGTVAAQGNETVLEVFKTQLKMEQRLLASDLASLDRIQEQLRGATDRLLRLNDDLLRAEREGEDATSFAARSDDIRRAEAELEELTRASQQLRTTMAARRGSVDQLQEEIKRLQGDLAAGQDELSGRWNVSIEPGALRGTFELRLDGTLLTGVYQLAGGWRGSLRGTFIGGNIRLERIDSQLGLVAIYTARLVTRNDERRLEGRWESTNLADGMAQSGTWVARRETER